MKQPNTITGADLGERMVSMYDGVLDKKGKPIAMMEVLDAIKSGYWAEQVEAVRSAKPDAAEKIKSRLPAITVAGVFKTRCKTGLDSSSGCLVLDVDDLATRAIAEALRDALGRDPHVLAAFVSPGGLGVKAVVYIGTCADDAEAKSAWRALAEYLQDAHEVETDPSGKDVCRLCFVSHDPGAVVNLGEVRAFTARAEAAKPAAPKVVNTSQSASIAPDAAVIRSAVAVLDAGCSRADWLAIGCAIKNALGDSGFQIFDSWSATAPEKYDAGETRKLWNTIAADGGVTVGTLFKRAEDAGWINPTGRLALSVRRQQAAEQAEAEAADIEVEPEPPAAPRPWQTVTDEQVAEAIAGSRLETMVQVLAAVTVPPLPIQITLPKAIALAACALAQPVEFDRKSETRRGLDLARNVISTAGGQLCNIWTCIVGPSGCGKDVGNLPFRIALEHGVAIGHAGSAEGLADAYAANGAGLMVISELGPYLDKKSWQNKATGFLTQAWNQCSAKVVLSSRTGEPRDVKYCAPSLIAAVQPAVLAATGDTLLMDSGFLPRFLFSYLPEIRSWRPNTEPVDIAPLSSSFRAYKQIHARIAVPAGYLGDVMDEFVAHKAPLPGHYNRLVNEIGPRIAVMLAADPNNPNTVEITAEHWQRTGTIIRWFFAQAEQILGSLGEADYVRKMEDRLDRMLAWIRKHPAGVAKKHFSHRFFERGTTAVERDKDLLELEARGKIAVEKIGNKTMLKPTK